MEIFIVTLVSTGVLYDVFTCLEMAQRSIEATYKTQKNGATITYTNQGTTITIATASNGDVLKIQAALPHSGVKVLSGY